MDERQRTLEELDVLLEAKDPKLTKQWYQKSADKYDQYMKNIGYIGPQLVIDEFTKLNLTRNARLLDIGAGTGPVGALLQKNGYTNIDALDATPAMLEKAAERKCYNKLIVSFVTKDIKLPIDDQTYDAVFLCGCVCPGYINPDSFGQIIRIVKPGGFFLWITGFYEKFGDDFHEKTNEIVQLFRDNNLWQPLNGYPKTVENYLQGIVGGRIFVMKVI